MSNKTHGNVVAGSTSLSWRFDLLSNVDLSPVTGKVAADLTANYLRQGGTVTSISLSDLGSINAAYSSGGVFEVAQGLYRIDLPNAAIASGADWVLFWITCSGAITFKECLNLEDTNAHFLANSPGVVLNTSEDVYWAEVELEFDDGSSQDEYTVRFMKNGTPQTATSPTITAHKRSNAALLINAQTLTLVSSTTSYKYDAAGGERLPAGDTAIILVTGTIDAAPRTGERSVRRDLIT